MTAPDETPEEGKNLANRTECDLTIETIDGEVAAIVTITGMDAEESPVIVEEVESAIRSELDHLVRGDVFPKGTDERPSGRREQDSNGKDDQTPSDASEGSETSPWTVITDPDGTPHQDDL